MDENYVTSIYREYSEIAVSKGCLEAIKPGVYSAITHAIIPF